MAALVAPESYRQSLIAAFDSCPRRALYQLLSGRRSPGGLAARGTLFHRFAHQAINLMRANNERSIPIEAAMELLTEVLAQKNVPEDELVPITMKDMRWLRVLVSKWVYSTEISVEKIVDVERRLYANLTLGTGEVVQITGQLDVLMSNGPEGALALDHKTGFARPKQLRNPDAVDEEGRGLTELGWVQSVIYAFLVFENFPVVQRFTFREWHVLWGEAREVTWERWQMEGILDPLVGQVTLLHAAVQAGEDSERWVASPGPHCAMCARAWDCPLQTEARIPTNEAQARRTAGEWLIAEAVRKERTPLLKGWVEEHGPIEVPYARGRRWVGWDYDPDGKRNFGVFEPKNLESPYDPTLEKAARERGALADGERAA